ncbi:MAG TPA: MarR family transcriptional regulator [Opitutaceae bacterium]|nr:MarR family transcriptional regulator [Lacunisphaera sp.]HWA09176.1 MarR family transcriptional regulator [Opitutaceae bacterium]
MPVASLTQTAPSDVAAPEFSRECVEFFSEAAQIFGVPPSVGQIYGLLYASPQPLSFTDIVARLGISKGSASQGLQMLRSLGAINAATHDDDRREYFEPEMSLRKLVGGVLNGRITPLVAAGPERIERLRRLADDGGAAKDFYLDRVEQLETWRSRLKLALPVLNTLLGPKRGR